MDMDIAIVCFSFNKSCFTKDVIIKCISYICTATSTLVQNTEILQSDTNGLIYKSNLDDINLSEVSYLRIRIGECITITIGFIQKENPNYISIQLENSDSQLSKPEIIDLAIYIYQIYSCCFGIGGELLDNDLNTSYYNKFRIDITAFQWPKSYISRISNISNVLLLSERHIKSAEISVDELIKNDKFLIRRLGDSGILISIGNDFAVNNSNIIEYEALDKMFSGININKIVESFKTSIGGSSEYDEENEPNDQGQSVKGKIDQLQNKLSVAHQLDVFQNHVLEFDAEYLEQDKLPRNHIYRPYRFCSQDVVLGLTVVKHLIDRNALEVDVCLISEIPEYEQYSSTRMMLSFLLTEAFKCGGTLEIDFTKNVYNGTVPPEIVDFAEYLKVNLSHVNEGKLSSRESLELFLEMAGFSDGVKNKIIKLSFSGAISATRVCYAINKGLWTMPEIESLILGSPNPGGIFSGETPSDIRHLYIQDLAYSKAAVFGGYLDRTLLRRDQVTDDTAIELEDDINSISVDFCEQYFAKIYSSENSIEIPWIVNNEGSIKLDKNNRLIVLIRPRETAELEMFLQNDIQCAAEAKKQLTVSIQDITAILVPYEFEDISEAAKMEILLKATQQGIYIMSSKETSFSLNTEASNRLKSAKVLRQ
jgi:hypothetical protein